MKHHGIEVKVSDEVRLFTPIDIETMRDILLNYIQILTANEVPYNTATVSGLIIEARLMLNKIS